MSHLMPAMPAQAASLPRAPSRGLWGRWTLATMAGELGGFAVPTLAYALVWMAGISDRGAYPLLLLAGAMEGAILGGAQWLVLRWWVPAIRWQAWIGATAAGATLAWAIALLPSTIGGFDTLAPSILVSGAVVLGLVFVLSLGGAQWWVLRRHLAKAGWWIIVNAFAWPVGVAIPVVAMAAIPDDVSAPVRAVVALGSGVMMGAVVGAITGAALVWLLRAQEGRGESGVATS
jgi:hypothetical protein